MTDEELKLMLSMTHDEYIKYIDEQSNAALIRLKSEGASDKDLHLSMEINSGTLKQAGIKPSYLVPTADPQMLNDEDWEYHIPNEGKWEFNNGIPFFYEGYNRDTLTMALITNMGLKRLVEILPQESIDELETIIKRT